MHGVMLNPIAWLQMFGLTLGFAVFIYAAARLRASDKEEA